MDDVELLINAVRIRPSLWDKNIDSYKDRNEVARNWREICESLNADFGKLSVPDQKKNGKLKWNLFIYRADSPLKKDVILNTFLHTFH